MKNNQRFFIIPFFIFLVTAFSGWTHSVAAEGFTLRGKVLDTAGKGVEGAEVFIYNSINSRRPADFITAKTDSEGRYSIQLPKGDFWAVARVRQGEKFGPLSPNAKHSGEPLAIDSIVNGVAEQDFIVADIRDVARGQQKASEDYARVSGRVLDKEGKPVVSAYVIINKTSKLKAQPDYVSAWTDESGQYSLYIPPGKYFIGAVTDFPPDSAMELSLPLNVETSQKDITIDLKMKSEPESE